VRGDRGQGETGRGRSAETPSEIPAAGWKDILLRVYRGISENRILLVAAGVTFYALLAIFPGIAALISIYGLFADPTSIANHLDTIANVAPGGAIDVLHEEMTRLASQGGATLGISFLVSLAISLWTANSGVKAIFDALNIVYGEEEKRSFLKLNAITLFVTLGIVVFILLTLAAVVAIPVALTYIPLPAMTALVVKIGRWPILFALVHSAGRALQIRSEPHRAAMALDYLGQRVCCGRVARCFGPVLMVRDEFRQLQQDLWLARRSHRLHDLDLDLDHRRSSRRQAQCGDGTSNGPRKHHRATKAARETRGKNGRHGWGGAGLRSGLAAC
jgi:hypothetical protein